MRDIFKIVVDEETNKEMLWELLEKQFLVGLNSGYLTEVGENYPNYIFLIIIYICGQYQF